MQRANINGIIFEKIMEEVNLKKQQTNHNPTKTSRIYCTFLSMIFSCKNISFKKYFIKSSFMLFLLSKFLTLFSNNCVRISYFLCPYNKGSTSHVSPGAYTVGHWQGGNYFKFHIVRGMLIWILLVTALF